MVDAETENEMKIYRTRINGMDNPIGFAYEPLLCSWKVRESQGRHQVCAKIQVAFDEELKSVIYKKEGENLKCTGELLEIELKPCTRYYYKISVTSDTGESADSDICYFETGKRDMQWHGGWIGLNNLWLFEGG